MKKLLALLLALLMLLSLAGCGKQAQEDEEPAVIELTLWTFPAGDWGDPAAVETLLTHLPRVSYAPIQDIYNGKSVHLDAAVPKGRICMYDQEQAVAIYEYSHGDVYRCVRGIW